MKKFNETKAGKFINSIAPGIADVLPDKGILGIAKNIIDKATVSEEEKEAMKKELHDYELEVFKLEISDKQNARSREVELAKTGRIDYLMMATGGAVIIGFLFSVVAIIFFEVPKNNKEIFIHLLGMLEGAFVGGMVFYYFGASKTQ